MWGHVLGGCVFACFTVAVLLLIFAMRWHWLATEKHCSGDYVAADRYRDKSDRPCYWSVVFSGVGFVTFMAMVIIACWP